MVFDGGRSTPAHPSRPATPRGSTRRGHRTTSRGQSPECPALHRAANRRGEDQQPGQRAAARPGRRRGRAHARRGRGSGVRTAEWADVLRPAGSVETFQVAQYAMESVRVERCQAEERALLRRGCERLRPARLGRRPPARRRDDRRAAGEEAVVDRPPAPPDRAGLRLAHRTLAGPGPRPRAGPRVGRRPAHPGARPARASPRIPHRPDVLDPAPDTNTNTNTPTDARTTQAALAAGRIAELSRLAETRS